MLTLKEWMEIVDYKITEGSDYLWHCFGPNSYNLSSWNGEHDGYSFNIVFDTVTQEVYTVEACDYKNDRAYQLVNPAYKDDYNREVTSRGLFSNQAWDDVNFVELETDDDFFEKALAIKEGKDYDTRVSVPLELEDSELFELMKMAHERDMTLNDFVSEIITQFCESAETQD